MQAKKTSHATENRRIKKRGWNLNYAYRETDRSKIEELAMMITPMVSHLQSGKLRTRILREKSKNFRKVVSREIMCFKIMKPTY